MIDNFKMATEWLLVNEGGYVNHPKDPGGATNKGITQKVYDGYRKSSGLPAKSVREIKNAEVQDIYKSQYWDTVAGDKLPSGLDYSVYDFAVNSGPSRSIKFLQKLVGVPEDGVMGNITLGAIAEHDIGSLIMNLNENRWSWVKRLKTYSTFGKGWTRRIMGDVIGAQPSKDIGVIDRSMMLWNGDSLPIPAPTEVIPGKAMEEDLKKTAIAADGIRDPDNWMKISIGAAPATVTAMFAAPEGPMQLAMVAVLLMVVATGCYLAIQKFKLPKG